MTTQKKLRATIAFEQATAADYRAKAVEARRQHKVITADEYDVLANICYVQAEEAQHLLKIIQEDTNIELSPDGMSKQLDNGVYNGP